MALVRGKIKTAQLRSQPRYCPAEIGRMTDQIIDQAARVPARQPFLGRLPIAPAFAQRRLFAFGFGSIVGIGGRQG
jgi:hypothetical protein